MTTTTEALYSQLESHGWKGRVVSVSRLADLRAEIEGRQAQGSFDREFHQERLTFFSFSPQEDLTGASSLLVVALPRPQTLVTFAWRGQKRALVLPPTYWAYRAKSQQVQDQLAQWLAPAGHHVARARLPLKVLAVRSGLGEYGRNNICYVPGMGSFVQLVAFYSDLPCEADDWREPQMMGSCQKCQACQHKCPTQAIGTDRFLLHAERCIVFRNERSSDHPFPAWIDPAAHNALIGCMICQQVCPEDKPFLRWFDGNEEFSEEETGLLLRATAKDGLPVATKAKLERLDLLDSLDSLPRNLGVFFPEAG